MAINRRIRRVQEKLSGAPDDCREQVKLWRKAQRRRAARDPELEEKETIARVISLGLMDPFGEIESVEEAQRIIEEAIEVLGPEPKMPDCYDPKKELDLLESARPRPGSRPQ